MIRIGGSFLFCLITALAATEELWPGARYDASVPTPKQVLGFDFGERITWTAQAVQYLEALAKAAPSRMKMWDYAKTWEGRRMVYAAIGSEANIRRLPEIQAAMKKLSDPRKTSDAEARRLMENLPAIVWLAHSVHGNEISSTDASLATAYHLLAAQGDPVVQQILENTIVVIDPAQNPDGRDRFVHHYEISEGIEPDAEQASAEHNEGWATGRTNHYYFDMNRDWFALTQPETRGRIRILREWFPQVFVDLHEMGSESHYYFAPEAVPFNPHLVREQKDSLYWFGKNNAKYFDQFGFSYFTREVYDAFYPGYGASWPSYFGAIAMTYENGSTRGLLVRRSDELMVTFRRTVRRHFVTSIATCETAAVNRKQLLENFWKYQVTAIDEGTRENPREYILPRKGNVSNVDKLAGLLMEQGVEVKRLKAASGGHPAGSYVIPLAQPAKRLIRTLLDPQVAMDDKFVAEEELRRKRRRGSEIYDVTAWSVPLQFNVACVAANAVTPGASLENIAISDLPKGSVSGDGTVAYLVPWGTSAAGRFLAAALRADLRVHSSDKPFTQNGRAYPAGTLILKAAENGEGFAAKVRGIAESSGAEAVGVASSWVDDGPNYGSRWVQFLRRPRVALAWDRPAASGSAGHTRYVLERQYGYPVTPIRVAQIAGTDLSRFHVLVLPDAGAEGYANVLGAAGIKRVKDWVQAGGTLVALGSGAVDFLTDSRAAFLATQKESALKETPAPKDAAAAKDAPKPAATPAAEAPKPEQASPLRPAAATAKALATTADLEKAVEPETDQPANLHGILARLRIDQDHWLTAGVPETVHALVAGRSIYAPIKLDKGVNAGVFAPPSDLVASGYVWEEYRKQLALKPFLMLQKDGRGNVIAFTADPNYRAYLDGLNLLFLNAVFRGPAHVGGAGRE